MIKLPQRLKWLPVMLMQGSRPYTNEQRYRLWRHRWLVTKGEK